MYYSETIKNLFKTRNKFERQYKKFWRQECSFEAAMADPDRISGYWEIMSFFDRKISEAIKVEEMSQVIIS